MGTAHRTRALAFSALIKISSDEQRPARFSTAQQRILLFGSSTTGASLERQSPASPWSPSSPPPRRRPCVQQDKPCVCCTSARRKRHHCVICVYLVHRLRRRIALQGVCQQLSCTLHGFT